MSKSEAVPLIIQNAQRDQLHPLTFLIEVKCRNTFNKFSCINRTWILKLQFLLGFTYKHAAVQVAFMIFGSV